MGKNIKYGEFTFPSSPARPTGMKDGGMCAPAPKYAKGGPKVKAKREPEAMVRKEVALLRKSGAPKALISHEVREMSGEMDTPATKKAEVGMMRKAKAPLTMLKHEMEEPTGMKKGGMTKMENKVGKVMGEFKSGDLHSGSKSGPVVKNRKQAVAIGISEGKKATGYAKGGGVEAKLEKHANMPAGKAHGPGAGNKLAKGGVPTFSKVPKIGKMR
jgi:hypothetical protein